MARHSAGAQRNETSCAGTNRPEASRETVPGAAAVQREPASGAQHQPASGAQRSEPGPSRDAFAGSAGFDIAAICAHPDDAELVMGGTLALEAARGRRVCMVDLTRGESGSRGTPETRAAEAQEAARVLGACHRESVGLPDARLSDVPEQKDALVAVLRRLRPRVVLLQHWEQRHPDHAAASRIVYGASFLAGLRNYRPDLGDAFRPTKLVYATTMTEASEITPSFVVDITTVWEQKLRAISAFASQFTPAAGETGLLPLDRFREAVELAGRRHGQRIGVRYGEGFVTKEPLVVDDLLRLGGSSI